AGEPETFSPSPRTPTGRGRLPGPHQADRQRPARTPPPSRAQAARTYMAVRERILFSLMVRSSEWYASLSATLAGQFEEAVAGLAFDELADPLIATILQLLRRSLEQELGLAGA